MPDFKKTSIYTDDGIVSCGNTSSPPTGNLNFCPRCTGALIKNHKLAQGVKQCGTCNSKFFLLFIR